MAPRRKQRRFSGSEVLPTSQSQAGTVVFNVSGTHFEVLRQTILAHRDSLLASLVEDIGTDCAQPIFVDANPDRFAHILDWYRFGEMYVPRGSPVKGILRDARFFLLPDFVEINGTSHQVCPEPANDAHDATFARVVDHWPGFEVYVSGIIGELRRDFDTLGKEATQLQTDVPLCETAAEFLAQVQKHVQPKKGHVLTKWCETRQAQVWADQSNVCNQLRLSILLSELAKRGFDCDFIGPPLGRYGRFSQLELLVSPRCTASGWDGTGGEAVRVQLAGVDMLGGKLPVC